jgi:hypothetical protein
MPARKSSSNAEPIIRAAIRAQTWRNPEAPINNPQPSTRRRKQIAPNIAHLERRVQPRRATGNQLAPRRHPGVGWHDSLYCMLPCQSCCLLEVWLCSTLIVEHGIIKMANLLPSLREFWIDFYRLLITDERLLQRQSAFLRSHLKQVATNDPERSRVRKGSNCFVGKRQRFQRGFSLPKLIPWPSGLEFSNVIALGHTPATV